MRPYLVMVILYSPFPFAILRDLAQSAGGRCQLTLRPPGVPQMAYER